MPKRLLPLFVLVAVCLLAGLTLAQENTPTVPNLLLDNVDCDSVLEIWQIQNVVDFPNCLNDRVRTENNIVTGLTPSGFFMQTPPQRADTGAMNGKENAHLTSEGIYVYTGLPPAGWGIQVGDMVNVEGRVREFFNLTRLEVTGSRRVEVVSSGHELPEPIDLHTVDLAYATAMTMLVPTIHPMERYEGMRVMMRDAVVVAPTNQFDEFGVSVTGERVFREAGIERDLMPQFADLYLPQFDLNPELLEVDPPETGMPAQQVTVGSVVYVVGNLSYSYQDYQIWPSELDVELADDVLRPVRERQAGEFTIATQNVENFFDLTPDPNRDDSSTEDYVPDTQEAYAVRLRKMSAQIRENLGAPDIVALQEMENARALTDLAIQIYSDDPTLVYYPCIQEGNDGRGIDNAYLVRVATVSVDRCYTLPGTLTEPGVFGGTLYGRPPLVLEAHLLVGNGEAMPITLINLHIKSLSGIETNDTQQRRLAQAVGIASFVQNLLDADPQANIVVLGDLNAFQFSDGLVDVVNIIAGTHNPDEALVAPEGDTLEPNLINQVMRVPEDDRYSYIFNSTLQVLDHILTSPALDAYVTDVQFSRGNADALRTWFDVDNTALRTSDHDGLVMYIQPNQAMD